MTPNDPYYSYQWHFGLLGDIESIWTEFDGTGVNVGVFDDGVEQDHADLNDNYDDTLEHYNDDGEPNTTYDGHGTSVAGIIAAENNDIGGVGVAWGATITGVDFINDYSAPLNFIEDFDVTNHSWGYGPSFEDYADIGDYGTQLYWEGRDFEDGVEWGRDGLGSIAVKAAGNEFGNAQGEGLNSLHTVITVGAADQYGNITDYSNHGHNLLVSAGAAAYTTDRSGLDGYNGKNEGDFGLYDPVSDLDMTSQFGGTSAATPVVAGVVTLMLQANPGLGYRDVQNILAISASHTGSAYGAGPSGYENYGWDSTVTGTWNGGGMTFNPSYGFGLVDAFAAVRMAEIWGVMGDGALTFDNEVSEKFYSDYSDGFFDGEYPTQKTLTVTDGVIIEHVYLTVDIEHEGMSDVTITLIAPDGTESVVFEGDTSGYFNDDWTFGLTNYLGQSADGDWTVRVEDAGLGNIGDFMSFNLEFIGSEADTDTLWHFTDDFEMLAAIEETRGTINDTDGGSDWLNFAAITGDLEITLAAGADLVVDGTVWATLGDGVIENAVGGDGDDMIAGSVDANHLLGARGNDVLEGFAGSDTLDGGQGDDYLYGDAFEVGQSYGTSAQIYRLYYATLGRGPDGAGHLSWTQRIVDGDRTLEQVAEGFMGSAEFLRTYGNATNEEFVTLLFNNVLGREPGAGAQGFIDRLDDGSLSRVDALLSFSEGAEFVNGTRGDARSFIEARSEGAWVDDVFRLYQATLDRSPDLGGMENWIGKLGDGRDYLNVVTGFVQSTEFQNTYGSATNEAFVTLLYNNVLDRDPDTGGMATWLGHLDAGTRTREEVVRGFAQSGEFIGATQDDITAYVRSQMSDGDVLKGGGGVDVMIGGMGSDTFIFDADNKGTVTVQDLEVWDYLDFQGFDYAHVDDVVSNMIQDGSDLVFNAEGVTVIFKDTDISMLMVESIYTGEITAFL